jgi:hypothetical protein
LVYRNLQRLAGESLPHGILCSLEEIAAAYTARSRDLARELIRVSTLMKRSNIKAVPFKGPALGIVTYKDATLRRFGDLDILVDRHDVAVARDALVSAGYRPHHRGQIAEAVLNYYYEYSLYRGGPPPAEHLPRDTESQRYYVELHWNYAAPWMSIRLKPREVIQRSIPVRLFDTTMPGLSLEDNAIMLAVQGFKDCFRNLDLFLDLAQLIRSGSSMDWDLVFGLANELRISRIVCVCLLLAKNLGECELPHEALRIVGSDPKCTVLARKAGQQLLGTCPTMDCRELALFELKARECFRDRVHMIFAPSVSDNLALDLPPKLAWLYRFLRPLRLLGRLVCERLGIGVRGWLGGPSSRL